MPSRGNQMRLKGGADMSEIKVFCGGNEYDMGYAHGCYPKFRPAVTFRKLIAYLCGYLAGSNVWLGNSWTVVTNGNLVINRLTHIPESGRLCWHTIRLVQIECNSD